MLSDPYAYDLQAYGHPLSTCEYGSSQVIPPISSHGDTWQVVDNKCSLEPYVDKIYWTIDAESIYTYPNNVKWERA